MLSYFPLLRSRVLFCVNKGGGLEMLFSGRKELFNVWYHVFKAGLLGMNIGCGGDVKTSGEINAMKFVKEQSKSKSEITIVDVGANQGQYTQSLLKFFKNDNVKIHCFEPGHETFKMLLENLNGHDNITFNNFGLSNVKSDGILYYDHAGSGLASVYKRQLDYFDVKFEQKEDIKLDTLDNYCAENNITCIDFFKLDVEGNELNVLEGAKNTLDADIVKSIQIEFGGCNLDSRTFIRDFWNMLHEKYIMYRIMRNGLLEIKKYYERIEQFTTTNFFFVKR